MTSFFDPSIQRLHDQLPDDYEVRDAFRHGVDTPHRQGEIREPMSVLEEVTQRYEWWIESLEPGEIKKQEPVLPARILGIFAEVSARRETDSLSELIEHALTHSHGGSE